jgi:hypothetical protein
MMAWKYKSIRLGKNSVKMEHLVIWESIYGPIPKGKVIHHKNGNQRDNRIENLEIMSRSEHSKLHRLNQDFSFLKRPANHGTTSGYRRGCRCVLCRKRATERMRMYIHKKRKAINTEDKTLSIKQFLNFERNAIKYAVPTKIIKTERQANLFNKNERLIYDIIGGEPIVVWKVGMKYYELPLMRRDFAVIHK